MSNMTAAQGAVLEQSRATEVARIAALRQEFDDVVDATEMANGDDEHDPFGRAMLEAEQAIRQIRNGARSIDLSPQAANIRRKQHEMARAARLVSHSYGQEPNRRVRIFRDEPVGP